MLLSSHGALKLCDFGFARRMGEEGARYTDYVATRFGRGDGRAGSGSQFTLRGKVPGTLQWLEHLVFNLLHLKTATLSISPDHCIMHWPGSNRSRESPTSFNQVGWEYSIPQAISVVLLVQVVQGPRAAAGGGALRYKCGHLGNR